MLGLIVCRSNELVLKYICLPQNSANLYLSDKKILWSCCGDRWFQEDRNEGNCNRSRDTYLGTDAREAYRWQTYSLKNKKNRRLGRFCPSTKCFSWQLHLVAMRPMSAGSRMQGSRGFSVHPIHVNPERSFGGTNRERPSEASQLWKGGPGVAPRKISKTYIANGAIYVIPELYLWIIFFFLLAYIIVIKLA